MKKPIKISKISAMQFAYAFHKYINNQHNNGKITEEWNIFDEIAYQAAVTGIFEIKDEK